MNKSCKPSLTVALTAVLLLCAGCGRSGPTTSELQTSKSSIALKTSEEIFATSPALIFDSRNGVLYGMDSDARITFQKNGKVVLTEFGFAPISYPGTYSLSSDGEISVQLKNYSGPWPKMKIFSLRKELYLIPLTGGDGLIMGGRGGATETSRMNPFWPFKQVPK